MRFVSWILLCSLSLFAHSEELIKETEGHSRNEILKSALAYFSEGKYTATAEELNLVVKKLLEAKQIDRNLLGLSYYWKGICFNRLQEFPQAINSFEEALKYNYKPVDIHYEFGQALYAADKLLKARVQFKESLRRKFKSAISLYYIGYISKEMGELKKAFQFFKSINKLDEKEAKDVRQASEMQIADIYLEQVEKKVDAFKAIETVVIPQYQNAHDLDPESGLAPLINDKIVKLQRKYDLILFELRNGRPTLNPPYFVRFSEEVGKDTNVLFSPTGTTISKAKQSSMYSRTDVIGKYTFYHRDFFSISPEFRFTKTHYFNRIPEIYRNDNYLMAPAIRTSYEHSLWKKPASFLVDYDYNEAHRDVNAEKKLIFSSRSHAVTFGERFKYFNFGESTIRLRRRILKSYISSSDSNSTSFIFEQIKSLSTNTLLFYFSYDRLRVTNELYDTNALTFRTDLIMGRVLDLFTPSFGLAMTSTDPINDRENRGRELMINPSVRLTKTFLKSWRANLKYDYQKNTSNDTTNFSYKKSTYSLEVEYLF